MATAEMAEGRDLMRTGLFPGYMSTGTREVLVRWR